MPPQENRFRRASDLRPSQRPDNRIDDLHVRSARFYATSLVVMSFLNAWHYMSDPVGVEDAGSVVLYFLLGLLGLIGLLAFFTLVPRVDPSSTELDLDRDEALATVVASYRSGMRIGFGACIIFLGVSAFRWEREGVNPSLDYKYHLIFWPLVVLTCGAAWVGWRYRNGHARIAYEPLPGALEEVFREMRDSYRKARASLDELVAHGDADLPHREALEEFGGALDDLYEGAAALVRANKRTVGLVTGFPAEALRRDLDRERGPTGDRALAAQFDSELKVVETLTAQKDEIEKRLQGLNATIRTAHLLVVESSVANVEAPTNERVRRLATSYATTASDLKAEVAAVEAKRPATRNRRR